MKPTNSIIVFMTFSNKILQIMGLKRIQIHNKRFADMKIHYIIYKVVLLLTILILLFMNTCQFELTMGFGWFCIIFAYSLAHLTISINLSICMLRDTVLGTKMIKGIYSKLSTIDSFINFPSFEHNRNARKMIAFIYSIYLILKMTHLLYNINVWEEYSQWDYFAACVIVDCDMIRFSLELNAVSRQFELLNNNLKFFDRLKCKFVKCNELDGVLVRIWNVKRFEIRENSVHMSDKNRLEKLLSIHNKLVEVIYRLNGYYGLTVSLQI